MSNVSQTPKSAAELLEKAAIALSEQEWGRNSWQTLSEQTRDIYRNTARLVFSVCADHWTYAGDIAFFCYSEDQQSQDP